MPTVALPDGRTASFPDDMSKEDIQNVLQRQFPPTGQDRGLGETIGSALMQIPYGVNEALGSLASGAEYAADVALGPLYDRESRDSGPISSLFLNKSMTGDDPKTKLERAMRSGGNMLGASAPTLGLPIGAGAQTAGKALASSANAGKRAVSDYLLSYGKNPASMLVGDAAGAVGAGVGGQVADETGAPRIVGELAGGLAGGFAASGGLTGAAIRKGKKIAGKVSPTAQKAAARDFVKARVGDELSSDAAQANLARSQEIKESIPEFNPRLGEASGVPSLVRTQEDLDNALRGADMDAITSRQAASRQAVDKFAETAGPNAIADAEAALGPVQNRIAGIKSRLSEQSAASSSQVDAIKRRNAQLKELLQGRKDAASNELALARQADTDQQLAARDDALAQSSEEARVRDAAQEAFRRLDDDLVEQRRNVASIIGPKKDKAKLGADIRNRLNDVRKQRSNQLSAMAESMGLNDADFTTPFKNFVARVDAEVTPQSPFQEPLTVPDAYKAIMNADALPRLTFKDVKTLRERVGRDIRDASAAQDGASRIELRNLLKIREMIDEELLSPGNSDIPEGLAQNYQTFRKAYFDEYIEPFERSATNKVRRKDGKAFYRTLDEDVASSFISTQDGAKQYASLFKDSPEAVADMEAALFDDLADTALADGVFRYPAFERWVNKKRGVLDQFPEIASKVDELFIRVRDVESNYAANKSKIGERKADALSQIGKKQKEARKLALNSRKSTTQKQRQIEQSRDADIDAIKLEQIALEESLKPIEARMETLANRQKQVDATVLGKKLKSLANETTTPEQIIQQAVGDERKMLRLVAATRNEPQARKALQRVVWDQARDLDSAKLSQFIERNEPSLKMLLGKKHIEDLKIIQDARAILERAPEVRGQPISTDPVKQITEATGLNPQASIARYVNVQRGRSSKAVEMGSGLAYWFGRARKKEAENLLRSALDDPDIARRLIDELSAPAVREGKRPPSITRIWALNAALGNDGDRDAR